MNEEDKNEETKNNNSKETRRSADYKIEQTQVINY